MRAGPILAIVLAIVTASTGGAAAQPGATPPAPPPGTSPPAPAPAAPLPPPAPVPATPMPPPAAPAPGDPGAALRDANAAATAGDWARVVALVQPLLAREMPTADLAEAHRLAGLAAYFANRHDQAEAQFLAYLRLDLDGRLDPALYPPEAVYFFEDVRARHAAELRARRPRARRYLVLNLLPPYGQFQNGERVKGWIVGGMLGSFIAANVTSYLLLRSWCTQVSGSGGGSLTCDDTTDHAHGATIARGVLLTSAVGIVATYVYGVYDGIRGYRRISRERAFMPYASPTNSGAVFGIGGSF